MLLHFNSQVLLGISLPRSLEISWTWNLDGGDAREGLTFDSIRSESPPFERNMGSMTGQGWSIPEYNVVWLSYLRLTHHLSATMSQWLWFSVRNIKGYGNPEVDVIETRSQGFHYCTTQYQKKNIDQFVLDNLTSHSIVGTSRPTALAKRIVCSACLIKGASIISIPPFPSPKSKPNAPLEDAWERCIRCKIVAARWISRFRVSTKSNPGMCCLPLAVGTKVFWMVSTWSGWIACWWKCQCQASSTKQR